MKTVRSGWHEFVRQKKLDQPSLPLHELGRMWKSLAAEDREAFGKKAKEPRTKWKARA